MGGGDSIMTAKDADKPATGMPSWLAGLAQRRWARWLVVLLALPPLFLIASLLSTSRMS
jgi:hypothetical protein